jgi:hypothetical protein
MKKTNDGELSGKIILYKGKKVEIVEEATGFVKGPKRYWVKALEPVKGYKPGEEITVTAEFIQKQLKETK